MTNRTTNNHRVSASVRFGIPNTEASTNRTPNRTLGAGFERATEHLTEHGPNEHPPRSRTEHLPFEDLEPDEGCPVCGKSWSDCSCDVFDGDAA